MQDTTGNTLVCNLLPKPSTNALAALPALTRSGPARASSPVFARALPCSRALLYDAVLQDSCAVICTAVGFIGAMLRCARFSPLGIGAHSAEPRARSACVLWRCAVRLRTRRGILSWIPNALFSFVHSCWS